MFTGVEGESRWLRRYRVIGASVGAHVALLVLIVFSHQRAIELEPASLAWGDGQHSYKITYLPAGDGNNPEEAKLVLPTSPSEPPARPLTHQRKVKKAEEQRQVEANAEAGERNSRAGSPLGTVLDGPISGHEVHVAYPVVYPDPPVNRAELPRDLAGDVVIEVTIDSQGNVVETKIVQAIGHGIDEKIEATLRQWHYQPATLDGVPVASRHDVHFHFPS